MGPHGVPMRVATDKATAAKVRAELVVDYVAREIELTQKHYEETYNHQSMEGWRFVATLDD